MHLQGARWDDENRIIDESKPKEEYCVMSVINCRLKIQAKSNKMTRQFINPLFT